MMKFQGGIVREAAIALVAVERQEMCRRAHVFVELSLRIEGGFAFFTIELWAMGARVLCEGSCVDVAFVASIAAEARDVGHGAEVLAEPGAVGVVDVAFIAAPGSCMCGGDMHVEDGETGETIAAGVAGETGGVESGVMHV